MNIDQIKSLIASGKTKEEIYLSLLNGGQKVDDINASFLKIDSEKVEKEDLQKKTITIMVIAGAILIGAGVFSFVASNWQYMDRFVKVAVLVVATSASYLAGWIMGEKYQYKRVAGALIFLGTIIYGASIFLVAQIFNLRANWPDGFILWMFGILAVAFALDSSFLFLFAIPIAMISFIASPFIIFDQFESNPFLFTSSILLLAATAVSFGTGYYFSKKVPDSLKKFY
ncbi:MAG: DUF2157 domain-containing protein [bacterium]